MASHRAWIGISGFAIVILSAPLGASAVSTFGVLQIGLGGGLFSQGTLTATINLTPR